MALSPRAGRGRNLSPSPRVSGRVRGSPSTYNSLLQRRAHQVYLRCCYQCRVERAVRTSGVVFVDAGIIAGSGLGGIGMDLADRLAVGGIALLEERFVASDRIRVLNIDLRLLVGQSGIEVGELVFDRVQCLILRTHIRRKGCNRLLQT